MSSSAASQSIAPAVADDAFAAGERIVGIDAMRAMAFVAVVVIHGPYYGPLDTILHLLARFAVPFFFMATGFFLARSRDTSLKAALALPRRLAVPFLFWTACYVVAAGPPLREALQPHYLGLLLLGWGPGFHLWYLPTLAVSVALLVVLRRWLSPYWMLGLGAAFYLLSLALGAYFWPLTGQPAVGWSVQHSPQVAFVFLAAGYCAAVAGWRTGLSAAVAVTLLGAATQVGEVALLKHLHTYDLRQTDFYLGTLPYGVGAFLVSWHIPRNGLSTALAAIGRYGLGLYAAHLLVLRFVESWIPLQGPVVSSLIVLITVVLTVVLCLSAARIKVLRPLVR
jgi:surface polysaccharide O-acyltransferase-like enzyme